MEVPLPQFAQSALDKSSLRLLLHEGQRPEVGRSCVVDPAESTAEIGASGVSNVIVR